MTTRRSNVPGETDREVGPEREHARYLMRLHEAATRVWEAYREHGPGRVDEALYQAVAAAADALEDTLATPGADEPIAAAVRSLRDLAHRCARTSLGLCFITGEAGLIPRPDQHAAYEQGLATIRAAAERLGAGTDA